MTILVVSKDKWNRSLRNEADTLTKSTPRAIKHGMNRWWEDVHIRAVVSFGQKLSWWGRHIPKPPSCFVVVIQWPTHFKCLLPPTYLTVTIIYRYIFCSFGILNILLVLIFIQTCKFEHHRTHMHSELHKNCWKNLYSEHYPLTYGYSYQS